MQMNDMQSEFRVLFEQREELERSVSEAERAHLAVVGSHSANIAELMIAAQELAEPEPAFFTRG
jgi:hypothetical protein